MTRKRRTARKPAVLSCLILLACLQPADAGSRKERFWETVDVREIVKGAEKLRTDASQGECEKLVRLNLRYIYFNFLAEDEFIALPKPETVAGRISTIFSLADQLRVRLDEGRRLCEGNRHPAELRMSARKIGRSADQIYSTFHNFFQEDHQTPYEVGLSVLADDQARYAEYLADCEKIWNLLHEELHHYFLNPSPGVVDLTAYRGCSIPVLVLSIRKLSSMLEKSLAE